MQPSNKSIGSKVKFLTFLFFLSFSTLVMAKCVYPAVNTWIESVSYRNVAGYFHSMQGKSLIIINYKDRKKIKINISEVNTPYSAFGGDGKFNELNAGIAMRVWYKHCKLPNKGVPMAAHVEFFSNDPKDQPADSYFTDRGV